MVSQAVVPPTQKAAHHALQPSSVLLRPVSGLHLLRVRRGDLDLRGVRSTETASSSYEALIERSPAARCGGPSHLHEHVGPARVCQPLTSGPGSYTPIPGAGDGT